VAVVVVVVVGSGIPSLENKPFPETFSVPKALWEAGVCKDMRRGSNGSVNGEVEERVGWGAIGVSMKWFGGRLAAREGRCASASRVRVLCSSRRD